MYFWKCWRDYRAAFFVFLSLIGLWSLVGFAILSDVGGWISRREFPEVWYASARGLLIGQVGFVFLAAFALGSSSIGDDFSKGIMPFLLTRPRSRAYLLGVNWAAGAAVLLTLTAVSQVVFRLAMGLAPRTQNPANFSWRGVAVSILMPFLFYSLTFFFTLAFKSGKNGSGAALLLVIAYMLVAIWFSLMAGIRWPYSPGPGHEWWTDYPVQEAALLLAFSSALLFAANQVFSRQEL